MTRAAPAFWQHRGVRAAALLPLAGVFMALAEIRHALFRHGGLRAARLPVPVVVVGNIAVGGSGKTPVVAWLVERLRAAGWRPGIISRGYGAQRQERGAVLVTPDSDPLAFGDEAVLLARLCACPVVTAADRPAAARHLLETCPACDVIVSDDGMQHYRLHRDVEIAVVDERTLGNRWRLPAGPLREGVHRLRDVDVVLAHGPLSAELAAALSDTPVFDMRLQGTRFRSLCDPATECDAAAFGGRRVHAVAGIGRPERFFAQLSAMGLDVVPHAFPDHHPFCAADLDFAPGEPKIMTGKDAVKCQPFASADMWELPVTARVDEGAMQRIQRTLEKLRHGPQTA